VLEKVNGDEVVDSVDNVHVDADKVGTGPHAGELQWGTFYSGKVVNGGTEAARDAGNTHICIYMYLNIHIATFGAGKVVKRGAEAARGAGNICMYLYVCIYMYIYIRLYVWMPFTLAR